MMFSPDSLAAHAPPCGPSLPLSSNRKENTWASSLLHKHWGSATADWDGILMFGNTAESPWATRGACSTRGQLSEIGIRLKQGVSSLGLYQSRALGGGASGILENSKLRGMGTCLQKAFGTAALKGRRSAYWPDLMFWYLGSRFCLPWMRRRMKNSTLAYY